MPKRKMGKSIVQHLTSGLGRLRRKLGGFLGILTNKAWGSWRKDKYRKLSLNNWSLTMAGSAVESAGINAIFLQIKVQKQTHVQQNMQQY